MTRLRAALIFLAVWACVYLPGLGSTELKGEEGRRILPAVTMLDTGNWLVPYVGGKPFLRKPPLVNWMIAGSFALTGVRNEWAARLPSALCVLALGLTLIALSSGRGWMNAETALVAAIMATTSFGLLAKARFAGAEIEGIYVPLTALAMATWMAWWTQRRSPWLTWTVPWIFLGLACLAKGPTLHLIFFYAIVLAVTWKGRAWRELVHPAHLAGLALCAAIFLAWFVPFRHTPESAAAMQVWKHQGIDRFLDSEFVPGNYFTNIPRGLMDELPWLLFAPFVVAAQRRGGGGGFGHSNDADGAAKAASEDDAPALSTEIGPDRLTALTRGVFFATVFCFFAVLLAPWGVLPRYVLPLTLPWAVLVAFALERRALRRLVYAGAAVLAASSLLYGMDVTLLLKRYDSLRPVAAQVDAAMPPGKRLIIYDPGYRAEIFYLHTPYAYAPDFNDIPADAEYVLARGAVRRRLAKKRPDLVVTHVFHAKHNEELLLLQPGEAVPEDARPVAPKSDVLR